MSVDTLQTNVINTADALEAALELRVRVFVDEQRVPHEEEVDDYDALPEEYVGALHVLSSRRGEALGTGRLIYAKRPDETAKIGRVAVSQSARGLGVGRAVMELLHEEARKRGISEVELGAQLHAIPFYEKLGYQAYGDVFLDANIEHRMMRIDLP
ncbi:MAG: GNAT family N-acetyltransferase [Myxococcota bacterium]|nr:GNAT family N-acetyltransferase [Myxococcota bacterium]